MSHSINVTKENDPLVRDILSEEGILFDVYDRPEDYSVITVDALVPLTTVESIIPLTVESGTQWDWENVATDGSTTQNDRKDFLAYVKALAHATELPVPKFCSHCGMEYRHGSCPNCGQEQKGLRGFRLK